MGIDELHWLQHALLLAQRGQAEGEVPVGAVLVKDHQIISEAWNQPIALHDPTAHAEINALRQAGLRLQNYRLLNTTLYVTLEPCMMCVGAMLHARVSRLVFGAYDPKAGAVTSLFQMANDPRLNHRMEVQGGVMSVECGALLKQFFKERRT